MHTADKMYFVMAGSRAAISANRSISTRPSQPDATSTTPTTPVEIPDEVCLLISFDLT